MTSPSTPQPKEARGVLSSDGSTEMVFYHDTVMPHEPIQLLEAMEGKVIVDGTLGGGGHSELLLRAGARVIGIDRDPEAREYATCRLASIDSKRTCR